VINQKVRSVAVLECPDAVVRVDSFDFEDMPTKILIEVSQIGQTVLAWLTLEQAKELATSLRWAVFRRAE